MTGLSVKQQTLLNVLADNQIIPQNIKTTLKFTKPLAVKSYNYLNNHYENVNTRKGYIVALYQLMDLNPSLSELVKEYRTECYKLQQGITDKISENINENPNFVSYSELKETTSKLRKEWLKKPEDKLNNLTYLVYALYTKAPPLRSEYANMEILDEKPDGAFNALINQPKDMYFYVNKDKVSNYHKPLYSKLSDELAFDIKLSLAMFPRKYLLQDYKNENPISTKKLSRMIQSVKSHLTIPLLRSAYISNFYKSNPSEKLKDELAKNMRHSKEIAQMSYKKINVD